MEYKKIASTDKTYCYGVGCKEFKGCPRYKEHYEFKEDEYYSFMFYCERVLSDKKFIFGELKK